MTEPNFSHDFNSYCTQPSTSELLSEMINNFEEYLSSIIIDIDTEDFRVRYNNNLNENSDYSFKSLKTNLEEYMTIISNKYITMFTKDKNIDNYAKIIDLLIIATIKLYEFIYIINESNTKSYIEFKQNHPNESKEFFEFIITKYFETLNKQKENDIYVNKINIDIYALYLYLTYSYNASDLIFPYAYDVLNKYIRYIKKIIDMNYFFTDYKDDYITIPQYEGICWFTSFLTGICYSDKNKQLLLEKFSINQANYKDIYSDIDNEKDPKILLTSFVYNVILHITSEFKKYSDYEDDCFIHTYLKKMPIRILIAFYNYYFKQGQTDKIPEFFKSAYKSQKPNTNVLSYDEPIENFGLAHDHASEIYTLFYKCLNIDVLNLFINNEKLFIQEQDKQKYLNSTYDIIVFCTVNNEYFDLYNSIYKLLNLATLTIPIDYIIHTNNTVPFDKDNYILDFITHITDHTQKCSKYGGCGHCISAIQYDTKQYFHDTANLRFGVKKICHQNEIYITCKLIKSDWLDNIHNPLYLYTINKCNLIQFLNTSKIYNIIREYSSGKHYFSMTQYAMLIFIKKSSGKHIDNKIIVETPRIGGNEKNKYLINKIKNNHYIYINQKKIKLNIENAKLYILLDNKKVFLNKNHLSINDNKYYITI